MSFPAQIVSFVIAVFLPAVQTSIYMWNDADDVNSQRFDNTDLSIDARKASIESGDNAQDDQKLSWARIEKAGKLLWSHFKAAYTDKTVLTWSIWWALAMAGFLMIQTYVQLLWQEIDTDRDQFYNAGVEAALTLFGAAGCLVNFLLAPTEVFFKYNNQILYRFSHCSLRLPVSFQVNCSSDSTHGFSPYVR